MARFQIRPFTHDDIEAISQIHVAGWQSSYTNIVDQDYLDSLSVEDRMKSWQKIMDEDQTFGLIAEDEDGKAAGFTSFGRLRTPPPGMSPIRPLYASEIYAIYILPDFWRQGCGTYLLSESCKKLKEEKFPSVCLWVLEKNKRAISFYKALGGQRCGKNMIDIGPNTLKDVCFGWRNIDDLIM